MDRAILLEHLATAKRHVDEGEARIEKLRGHIVRLAALGAETGATTSLLEVFEQTEAIHVAHLDRILDALHGEEG